MLDKTLIAVRVTFILLGTGLVASLFLTSPEALGPFGLTAWFSCLLIFVVSGLVLGLMRWHYPRTRDGFMLALRRSFLFGLWGVALLALSSLRQLSIRDIILITILGLLVDYYMQKVQK